MDAPSPNTSAGGWGSRYCSGRGLKETNNQNSAKSPFPFVFSLLFAFPISPCILGCGGSVLLCSFFFFPLFSSLIILWIRFFLSLTLWRRQWEAQWEERRGMRCCVRPHPASACPGCWQGSAWAPGLGSWWWLREDCVEKDSETACGETWQERVQ